MAPHSTLTAARVSFDRPVEVHVLVTGSDDTHLADRLSQVISHENAAIIDILLQPDDMQFINAPIPTSGVTPVRSKLGTMCLTSRSRMRMLMLPLRRRELRTLVRAILNAI
jgi:hypothetical protein